MHESFIQKPVLSIYDRLTSLYPSAFRAQFSAEQREVFLQSLRETAQAGRSPIGLLLRELAGLPAALAGLHLAALRAAGWPAVLEFCALALVFFLPGLGAYRDWFSPTTLQWIGLLLSNILTVALVAGVFLGFPRWYLPYTGFILALLLLLGSAALIQSMGASAENPAIANLPLSSRLVYTARFEGLLDLALLGLVALGTLLARPFISLLKLHQSSLLKHPRRWSDVSFLLYGAAILSAVLTFENYRYIEPLSLLTALILIAGAWAYLRADTPTRGLLALLTAVALAFTLIAAGKWLLLPYQDWPGWFETHPLPQERWYEAGATLIDMLWLSALIASPAFYRWIVRRLAGGPLRVPAGHRS